MIVEHYICDKCGYDTKVPMAEYDLPKGNNCKEKVHLCKKCIIELAKWMNDSKE